MHHLCFGLAPLFCWLLFNPSTRSDLLLTQTIYKSNTLLLNLPLRGYSFCYEFLVLHGIEASSTPSCDDALNQPWNESPSNLNQKFISLCHAHNTYMSNSNSPLSHESHAWRIADFIYRISMHSKKCVPSIRSFPEPKI